MAPSVLTRFTMSNRLWLISDQPEPYNAFKVVLDNLDWEVICDAINDQLPEGFRCKLEDA